MNEVVKQLKEAGNLQPHAPDPHAPEPFPPISLLLMFFGFILWVGPFNWLSRRARGQDGLNKV